MLTQKKWLTCRQLTKKCFLCWGIAWAQKITFLLLTKIVKLEQIPSTAPRRTKGLSLFCPTILLRLNHGCRWHSVSLTRLIIRVMYAKAQASILKSYGPNLSNEPTPVKKPRRRHRNKRHLFLVQSVWPSSTWSIG